MSSKFRSFITSFVMVERHERLKLLLLTTTFFLIISAYTIVKELKDSIFVTIVGKEYVPWASLLAMFMLVPAVLFYSFLVDKVRRYQLLYFYSIVYGIVGLISAYLIGHPVIGINNTDSSPYRLFGWFFYFFIEGFSPFVISVFWAFLNSIYSPDEAKNNYALLVSGSKIGGMIIAGFAWWLFSYHTVSGTLLFSDVVGHQILFYIFSCLILCIPLIIHLLIKKVPGRYLHGYEAVYQFEKERDKKKSTEKPNIISGLIMLVRVPYVLGIFGMSFFYEAVIKVLSYQRLGIAQASSHDISGLSLFLFKIAFVQHLVGFIISFIGTRSLLTFLGERVCLLLIPFSTALLLLYLMMSYTPIAMLIVLIALRAINYAFSQPVRESLYIPTVKDMKFKSKSWIDAFGAKVAKSTGSTFNLIAERIWPMSFFLTHSLFFVVIVGLWSLTAYLLGNRFNKAIAHNEVIGAHLEK